MAGACRWQKFHTRVMSVRRNGARHTCMMSSTQLAGILITQVHTNKRSFAKAFVYQAALEVFLLFSKHPYLCTLDKTSKFI